MAKKEAQQKPPRVNRVWLGNQRVKPETLEKLKMAAKHPDHLGIGKSLDHAIESMASWQWVKIGGVK